MTWLQLFAGLALLLAGGEFLVRGAVGAARALGVSPLFIGLTLVGFGTSAPELVASLIAAFDEAPGIAVGNVVGSNIANILLILGCAAVATPLPVSRQGFHRDAAALAVSTLVAATVILLGSLTRPTGLAMVLLLFGYIIHAYRSERGRHAAGAALHEREAAASGAGSGGWKGPLALALASLAAVVLGAKLLVEASILLAAQFGVSDTVIGLTVVAVGTSLPELAVSILAALRGQGAVAVGNVVGSNIYNALFILGTTAAVHPIEVPAHIAAYDVWALLGVTGLLLAFMLRGGIIGRVTGAVFLGAYAGYLLLLLGEPQPG